MAFVPIKHFFSTTVLSYKTKFYHYYKWCRTGNWKEFRIKDIYLNKKDLNIAIIDMEVNFTHVVGKDKIK